MSDYFWNDAPQLAVEEASVPTQLWFQSPHFPQGAERLFSLTSSLSV